MTKKELILDATAFRKRESVRRTQGLHSVGVVRSLAKVYSVLLQQPLSSRHTLKLVHAQLALGLLLLFGGLSLLATLLLGIWAFGAIWSCRDFLFLG